jgi:hypothetical protein
MTRLFAHLGLDRSAQCHALGALGIRMLKEINKLLARLFSRNDPGGPSRHRPGAGLGGGQTPIADSSALETIRRAPPIRPTTDSAHDRRGYAAPFGPFPASRPGPLRSAAVAWARLMAGFEVCMLER